MNKIPGIGKDWPVPDDVDPKDWSVRYGTTHEKVREAFRGMRNSPELLNNLELEWEKWLRDALPRFEDRKE